MAMENGLFVDDLHMLFYFSGFPVRNPLEGNSSG